MPRRRVETEGAGSGAVTSSRRKPPTDAQIRQEAASTSAPKKRKKPSGSPAVKRSSPAPKRTKKSVPATPSPAKETRLARFIPKPTSAVQERIARAFTHRLYLIDKNLCGSPPSECDFFVLGATGNVYTVKLALRPWCTCPDHAKGNTCKHILFVMLRVLKLPRHDPRVWQKTLLPSELNALFENISVSDGVLASSLVRQRFKQIIGESSTTRADEQSKPLQREIDGDCPICYEPMASSDRKPSEPVVFCKTCGNNVHADCFKRWSQSKKHGSVTCIYCRAVWESDGKGAGISSNMGGEYINLASFSEAHGPDETTLEALYPSSYQWWHRNR